MKRIDLALGLGLVAAICITSFTAFAQDCDAVRQSVVRLHILANSDSDDDQALKLAVRDAILAETSDLFENARSKEQAGENVTKQLAEIESIAENVITMRGYDYKAEAEFVNMFFETKSYGEIVMPAGHYDAVRVKIGSAKGKNWWCVMFPPMCVPAVSEKTDVEIQIENLGQQPKYVPKFAVVELVEKITQKTDDKPIGAD